MALPLPKVVADVGPGGGLVTALGGINSLQNDMILKKINEIKAQYAPMSAQAEAASKLAYANLMGPQFLAKLMGNPDVVANSPDLKNPATVSRLYQAGMGAGTGNALLNSNGENSISPQQNPSFSNHLTNKFKELIDSGNSQPPQQKNALSYVNQPTQVSSIPGTGSDSGMMYDPNGNNITGSPLDVPNYSPVRKPTYEENAARYSDIKEEGKELGKIRADDIKDLSDVVFSGKTKQATLDNITEIISSPAFEEIRQTPILGGKELAYFQRYGTPEQQNMVGQLMTLSGNIIKDSARDFAGQFRKGEQQLLENMKINPSDTFNAMRGKMEQLNYLNRMITERSALTGQIMSQNHMNKLQAESIADKKINGDALRSQIHNQLNPKPTDEDINFMAKKYNTTPDEIKKRLKEKGIL